MRIRFIKNPVGLYNLAYDPGDEVDLPDQQARELIETGHAVPVKEQQFETGATKVKSEKARTRK